MSSLALFHGLLTLSQYLDKIGIDLGWLETRSCFSKYTSTILSVARLINISKGIQLYIISLWLRTGCCSSPLSLRFPRSWVLLSKSSVFEWSSMVRFETVTCIYLETQSMACIRIFEVINSSAVKVSTMLLLQSSLKHPSCVSSWISI